MEGSLSLGALRSCLSIKAPGDSSLPLAPAKTAAEVSSVIEKTVWGRCAAADPPVAVEGIPTTWAYPASNLGSVRPQWD